jgi:hypothetical protein
MKIHAGKSQGSLDKSHLLQLRPFRGQEQRKQALLSESPHLLQLRPFRETADKNAVAGTVAAGQSAQHTRNVVQLVRYRGRQEVKPGVRPEVQVAASLNELRIEDKTQTDQSIGDLSGFLNYRIVKKDREAYLDHIETHPPGLGLGALLMLELALKAEREGCEKISISMPAHTAVGAYLLFGALPESPARYNQRFGQFFDSYTADQTGEEELGSKAELEMKEKVKHKMETALYLNPNMTEEQKQEAENRFTLEAFDQVGGVGAEAERHAHFRALSNTGLYFVPSELRQKSQEMLDRKWQPTGGGGFEIFENYF